MKNRWSCTEVRNTEIYIKKTIIEYWNHNKTWILSANTSHFNADIFIFNAELMLILPKMEYSEITQAFWGFSLSLRTLKIQL